MFAVYIYDVWRTIVFVLFDVFSMSAAVHRVTSAVLHFGNLKFKQERNTDQAVLPDNTCKTFFSLLSHISLAALCFSCSEDMQIVRNFSGRIHKGSLKAEDQNWKRFHRPITKYGASNVTISVLIS